MDNQSSKSGVVYLVGAGPGRKELLTLRALEVLDRADVVVYDYLVSQSVLQLCQPSAVLIDVGKQPGRPTNQSDINELLVDLASKHRYIVRLKGGDPFVFGRGGEEAEALKAAEISFEVVPGVSSVNGAPLFGGISLTHRGVAQGYVVVTGHGRFGERLTYDWDALHRCGLTLVVLMGVAHRAEISEELRRVGMDPLTPTAVIYKGTTAFQRVLRTTLSELGALQVESPAVMVIGNVAELDFSWLHTRPLFGLKAVVTRAVGEDRLSRSLEELGAEVVRLPTISISNPSDQGESLHGALERIRSYEWIVFTSSTSVNRTFDALGDLRRLGGVKVAAIGSGTKDTVLAYRVGVDFVPTRYVGETFIEEFPYPKDSDNKILLPRAKVARDVVPMGLRKKGWNVEVVEAYETSHVIYDKIDLITKQNLVLFASPSAVEGFHRSFGAALGQVPIGVIGPITAEKVKELGFTPAFVSEIYDFAGLVEATKLWWVRNRKSGMF